MTLAEAADRLGLDASTLRHQIRKGRLAATRHGPIWWVTETELERYRRASLGRYQKEREQ